MPPEPSPSEIFSACQVLFGRKASFSPLFLSSLRPDSLKSTFRQKALSTHPDRAAALGKDPAHLEREFLRVKVAYEVLNNHLKRRPPARTTSPKGRTDRGRPAGAATSPSPGTRAAQPREKTPPRKAPSRSAPPGSRMAPPPRSESSGPRAGATTSSPRPPSGPPTPPPGATPRKPGGSRRVSRFWKGSLPKRPLKFGQFLFFSGVIPARELLDALAWQRGQRPPFGQIARDWGILTTQQVIEVLRSKGPGEPFGECASRLGWMTPFEMHAVACRQKNLQRPFGHYFVERGLMDRVAMNQALLHQRIHNHHFLR